MNTGRLYQLGRRLMEVSRAAASDPGDPGLPPGGAVVLEDVLAHPGSSVGEIADRTGFAQSHVSETVAKLGSSGTLETAADPSDGRRKLVRVSERLLSGVFAERGARGVEEAVTEAMADPDPRAAERAVRMLEELSRLLLPDATRPDERAARREKGGG